MFVTQVWLLQTGDHLRQSGPAASTINSTTAQALSISTGESSFPRTLCASFFFASAMRWLPAFCGNQPKAKEQLHLRTTGTVHDLHLRTVSAMVRAVIFAQRAKTWCMQASLLNECAPLAGSRRSRGHDTEDIKAAGARLTHAVCIKRAAAVQHR